MSEPIIASVQLLAGPAGAGCGALGLLVGTLEPAVAAYGLRLCRNLGVHRVGWWLFAAFCLLALGHLFQSADAGAAAMPFRGAGSAIALVIPLLLLLGMAHTESVVIERLRVQHKEQELQRELNFQSQEISALVKERSELQDELARYEQQTEAGRGSEEQNKSLLNDNPRAEVSKRQIDEAGLRQQLKAQVIGQMAGAMADQFDEILSVIKDEVGRLLQAPPSEEVGASIQQLSGAAAKAESVTRQLRIAGGRQLLQEEALELNQYLEGIERVLRRLIGQSIVLETSYAPDLPLILGDVHLLEHIVLNVVLNARNALPEGGTISVKTSAVQIDKPPTDLLCGSEPGEFVCLSVRDTGCGMSAEVQARLFEPFFSTREEGKGLGLGLVSTLGAVRQLSGWIEVSTEPGAGTEFRILFPACSPPPNAPA